MQQILNVRKTLVAGSLLLAMSNVASAASEQFVVSVTTLDDVSILEVNALSYGTNVFIDAGGECTMEASAPGATVLQMDDASAAANYGDIAGTGCVDTTGQQPGEFRVTGLGGQDVTITIGSTSGGDYTFAPVGAYAIHDGSTAGDTLGTYTTAQAAAGVTTPLASSSDVGLTVAANQLMFTVGGTITIGGTPLVADQLYNDTYPVTVVY